MTSGLPKPQDFALMARQGYEMVVSLCHPKDVTRLEEDEDALVSEAGMAYVHLPIRFEELELSDYEILRDLLRTFHGRKVWLHCTHNKRVSTLVYIYNIIERSLPVAEAGAFLHAVWEPDELRKVFIDEALEKYAYQYL
jgi:protein tyrosine phosphatase (PTP) superfamily phosphohydrolase (DUF442 family)